MKPHISDRNNFAYLAIALVSLLFISAAAEQLQSHFGQHIVQGGIVFALAFGVWSIKGGGHSFLTGIGLVLLVLIATVAGLILDWTSLVLVRLTAMLLYFAMMAWLAVRQVLFTGPIDHNKIVGSVCIYFLLGLVWAMLYTLLLELSPTTFNGVTAGVWEDNLPDLLYFSFVTLTTLGFGDISPAEPIAKFLVYMEAVVGQLYIAILVASLVGIRISTYRRGSE